MVISIPNPIPSSTLELGGTCSRGKERKNPPPIHLVLNDYKTPTMQRRSIQSSFHDGYPPSFINEHVVPTPAKDKICCFPANDQSTLDVVYFAINSMQSLSSNISSYVPRRSKEVVDGSCDRRLSFGRRTPRIFCYS